MSIQSQTITPSDCILKQSGGRSFLVLKITSKEGKPEEVVMLELKNPTPIIRKWKEINELLDSGELMSEIGEWS